MFLMVIVIVFSIYFYTWMFNKIANTYLNAAGLWAACIFGNLMLVQCSEFNT